MDRDISERNPGATLVFFEQFRKGLTRAIEQNACAGEPQTLSFV